MKVLIIEDELPAFKRLSKLINEVAPGTEIIANIDNVKAAREWFAQNSSPDIVFLDIHLADGSGFDLLNSVNISCPVIFTTAHDNYAIEAFKSATIDYLLKPIKKEDLEGAFQKIKQFSEIFNKSGSFQEPKLSYKKRFLIRFSDHIIALPVEDIAYCYSENKATFARTLEGRNYPMDNNLDSLEQMLDPHDFFRINRQYIISLKAIGEMKTYTKARVIVTLKPAIKEQPIVSSERAADFKQWLAGEL
ncbi:MAG TPA: LytTR family DNA-binding domain-containing protein [Flavipsychrobacter sp.]|nr:LytTR family DNA-binding domain-containing protein [Flavipsychrobacter sp.]